MPLLNPVDFYCERAGEGFLAEPLNAATNLAFVIAAYILWRQFRAGPARSEARTLAILIAGVGMGSLSLHTFAVVLTAILDVVGIAVFILTFTCLYLRRVARWPAWAVTLTVIGYLGFSGTANAKFGATIGYLPAWSLLLILAYVGHQTASKTWPWLVAAALLFIPSVTFRALDHHWCGVLPRGTHFMWHVLNAGLLYLASRGLVAHLADRRGV